MKNLEDPKRDEVITPGVVLAQDHLGVAPETIPPITDFVLPRENPVAPEPAQGSDQPAWVRKLLAITKDVAGKSRMSVVIAEISVLTDTLPGGSDSGDPFFTTNIVCLSEPGKSDHPVLDAYLSAIDHIATTGTTINTREFHALHRVHVTIPARRFAGDSSSDVLNISSHRLNVLATPLGTEYVEWRK